MLHTTHPIDQAEPPLIRPAHGSRAFVRRLDWTARSIDSWLRASWIVGVSITADLVWLCRQQLWIWLRLVRAYRKELVSATTVMLLLVSLNPVSTAHAAYAAGSASVDPIQQSEFTYDAIEELDAPEYDGFASKPLVIATSIGRPEQELREQERKRQEQLTAQRRRAEQARRTTQATTAPARPAGQVQSEGNGYIRGYCTWWVKQRRSDIPNQWGNANAWLRGAQRSGYATGDTPQVGAIVVTGESRLGHVGYIEAVEGNEIIVSDMNVLGWNKVSQRRMNADATVIRGYIY